MCENCREETTTKCENCHDDTNKHSQQKSALLNTLNKCFEAVYEVYFQPQEKPLPRAKRVLYSLAGSVIFLLTTLVVVILKTPVATEQPGTESSIEKPIRPFHIDLVYATELLTTFAVLFTIGFSAIFASVIAAGYSRHGAIRYFVAGVVLPAFTLFSVLTVTDKF